MQAKGSAIVGKKPSSKESEGDSKSAEKTSSSSRSDSKSRSSDTKSNSLAVLLYRVMMLCVLIIGSSSKSSKGTSSDKSSSRKESSSSHHHRSSSKGRHSSPSHGSRDRRRRYYMTKLCMCICAYMCVVAHSMLWYFVCLGLDLGPNHLTPKLLDQLQGENCSVTLRCVWSHAFLRGRYTYDVS